MQNDKPFMPIATPTDEQKKQIAEMLKALHERDAPPAKAPTMDAVEAVARALYERHCAVMFPDEPIQWGRGGYATQVMEWQALARAALAAARPLIAAEWQPIETAPHDQRFIAAIEVQSSVAPTRWQMDVVFIDSETGELGYDCDFGWSIGDYSHWQPLPAPPTAQETIR